MRRYESEVAAGMEFIGYKQSQINLDELDIRHTKKCVLGQIYGDALYAPIQPVYGDEAIRLGFYTNYDMGELTEEWKIQISEKRALLALEKVM